MRYTPVSHLLENPSGIDGPKAFLSLMRRLLKNNLFFLRRSFSFGVILIILCQCAHLPEENPLEEDKIEVSFSYVNSKAKKVCIAGSFNNWSSQSLCMRRRSEGWSMQLLLSPGRYPYAFLIDDYLWEADPGAVLSEKTGFGGTNSILVVE